MTIREVPLLQGKSLLKGFLGGNLLIFGLLSGYGLIIQAVFIVFGILIILDSILAAGKGMYAATMVTAAIIGGIIGFISILLFVSTPYSAIIVIVTALVYFHQLRMIYKNIKDEKIMQKKKKEQA
jgi:membrane protein implicated in regulation of membrane protease activity